MNNSIWMADYSIKERDPLPGDITVDVLVIGGGMAGLLSAYLLQSQGARVAVIEADRTAMGITKNTTAKITSQHHLIYDKLITKFGEEKALQYAQANESAIKKYKEIIQNNNIDCNFEEKPAFVFNKKDTTNIEKEVKAAQKLNIPASFTTQTKLPFDIKGAVVFNNQAQFNPIKFLNKIAENLTIYEKTMANEIKKDTVITDKGNIKAQNIVVATHYPFMNTPGYYFLRVHQERSYVLALKNTPQIDGMYIDEDDKNGFSFRNYGEYLIFGGGAHRTGNNDAGGKYKKLEDAAKLYYPDCDIQFKWSAQDCVTVDNVPYIGHYSSDTPNLYVATGFNKWGMTSSMAAAMILTDYIMGRKNENAEIFNPQRFNVAASAKNLAIDVANLTSALVIKKLDIPEQTIDEVPKNQGKIIDYKGEKVGVYKNEKGEAFLVSVKCPHLGCELKWNPDELSWECPCHGSRFSYNGELIDNPARRGITIE